MLSFFFFWLHGIPFVTKKYLGTKMNKMTEVKYQFMGLAFLKIILTID